MHLTSFIRHSSSALLSASLIFSSALPLTADQSLLSDDSAISSIRSPDGQLRMLTANSALPVKRSNASLAEDVASQFAPAFNIDDPAAELQVTRNALRADQRRNIRYQQTHNGIPIIGAELIANLDARQQLSSMSGETSRVTITDLKPTVSSDQAIATAKTAVAKWHSLAGVELTNSPAVLKIYDPALIGPGNGRQHLVWQTEISPASLMPVKEFVLVDAHNGAIVLHFNTVDTALNRATYTANNLNIYPGSLICNESNPTCAGGDTDAQNAHRYAADTYNFYLNNHGRDSLDGAGMTLVSTVHYRENPVVPYVNAFWTGPPANQMVYGDGFPAADDVVAHELTHGFTSFTSNLLYYYQSGAINESFSDLWGEFVDLTNAGGTDTPAVRWQMGEDVPVLGAIRNMSDPTDFGDPDRMTSANYYTGSQDSGGVHTNSGVNNKAAYLMVDGDSFNGQTITGIGILKTSAIYYEAQTNLLTSGADYLDLYNALNQACQNLIGSNGITLNDCEQVNNALLAVEMNEQPVADFNPDAALCPVGSVLSTSLFYDDFESGLGNWTVNHLQGSTNWSQGLDYATSGTNTVVGEGTDVILDSTFAQTNQIAIPATGTYYLHFNHAYLYESSGVNNYDGGVIEYSTDNGASWQDAGNLIDSGRNYTGALSADNPLAPRMAFSGLSHGYNSTRLNLSSLAGQNFRFRFRTTADTGTQSFGWILDDVRIYSCVTNSAPISNAGSDQSVLANVTVNLDGSGSSDPDTDGLSYQWTQQAGPGVSLSGATSATASFTSPGVGGIVSFTLKVTDSFGQTSLDSVNITVDGQPSANAGADQTVDLSTTVNLDGSASLDPQGETISYSWVQDSGDPITLSDPTAVTPNFTAPATAGSLSFTLTVTDPAGQTGTDTVTITVQDPATSGGNTGDSGGGGGCSLNEQGRFDPLWLLLLLSLSVIHIHRRRQYTY